jgi:Uma2 family endonuclease
MGRKKGFTGRTHQGSPEGAERPAPDRVDWRQDQPVRISEFDEPEPDVAIVRSSDADYRHRIPMPEVAIVRSSDADYRHRIPMPEDVGLLVEVSETTLRRDRGAKRTAYAGAGVPVYWIVNLVEEARRFLAELRAEIRAVGSRGKPLASPCLAGDDAG